MSEQATLIEPETEEAEENTRRMDDELKLIGQLIRLLAQLEEPARGRVMVYLSDRYAHAV